MTAGILMVPEPVADPFFPGPKSGAGLVTTMRGRTVLTLILGSSAALGGVASGDGLSAGGASRDGASVCGAGVFTAGTDAAGIGAGPPGGAYVGVNAGGIRAWNGAGRASVNVL